MVTINSNHVDLDLHCPIGWSNSQTHILHIKLHLHLPTVQLLSYHVIQLDMICIYLGGTSMLCCSNVVQVPLSLNPFQLNLEFGTTHRVQMCYISKQV